MMDKFLKFYRSQDRIIFFSESFSVLAILVLLITTLLSLRFLPQRLPLFYSQPWGESQLIDKNQLLILPSLLALAGLVNLIISMSLHSSQLPLKRMLYLSTSVLALLFLITQFKIIFVFL